MPGDTFITNKAGAVGPHATASNTTFIEGAPLSHGGDLAVLADELGRLKIALRGAANDTGQLESLVAVSSAEDAARSGDGATAMAKLKAAGSWAWDTATKIGVSVAAEAIKKAVELG